MIRCERCNSSGCGLILVQTEYLCADCVNKALAEKDKQIEQLRQENADQAVEIGRTTLASDTFEKQSKEAADVYEALFQAGKVPTQKPGPSLGELVRQVLGENKQLDGVVRFLRIQTGIVEPNDILKAVSAYQEFVTMKADLAAASTEFLVPLPGPGSDMARVLIANRLLKARVETLDRALRAFLPPEHGDGWWCPTCQELVDGSHVTYQEHHDTCGTYLGNCQTESEPVMNARAALNLQ